MSSSRNARFRWPPVPCVEEEPASLARELHGLSKLGEKPGVEGACRRGTVDQYPVILSPDSPLPTSIDPPSAFASPGLENVSSDDNSSGLRTPPPPTASSVPRSQAPQAYQQLPTPGQRSPPQFPEPVVRTKASLNESYGAPPPTASSVPRSQAPQAYQQLPILDQRSSRQRRPQSRPRGRDFNRDEVEYFQQSGTRPLHSELDNQGRPFDLTNLLTMLPPEAPLSRSTSVRAGNSPAQAPPSYQRTEQSPEYQSDSSTTRGRPSSYVPSDSSITRGRPSSYVPSPSVSTPLTHMQARRSPDAPTLSERIEEKLRLRHELRELGSDSDTEPPRRPRAKSISPKILPVAPHRETRPISREPSRSSSRHPMPPTKEPIKTATLQEPKHLQPPTRGRATSLVAPAPPTLRPSSRAPSAMVSRSMSSDEAQASSSKPRRTNSVKFVDQPPRQSVPPQALTLAPKPTSSQKSSSPQRSTGGACVIPCPRGNPVSGYNDWVTLKGLPHLDICPSCVAQISNSRYEDLFVQSLPKPPNLKIRCAFSNAWTRLCWTQMLKKKHDSLEMLYQLTRPPPGITPCARRDPVEQTWYRVVDPETGMFLPRFHVCGSCARSVRILVPTHRDTLEHCPEVQERICDFVTSSPRFVQYIDLLDTSAARTEPGRRPDLRELISYVRRKTSLHDCRRDRPIKGAWHYIPELPELTVCEDCYDEVIWPLAKSNHSLAKSFSTSTHLLPGDRSNRIREASCQLYTTPMRQMFKEAILRNDYPGLEHIALRRFDAQRRYNDRRAELDEAERRGYDCQGEIRKAVNEWRKWE
ncbi:hypothetical protein N7466_002394 [Penicillium verhagenii]|uniref:uncharacterized protein n=1 Tax=Penicillium verhagenii TaxID=1562060 RepID=UPI00254501B1|nr:uncharacterized protein N7466_002394 [Penicillium verhagenii]KAJ5939260.1 hypothetical protein N7466_002394 [Penicillium verhagenii]